jgi:phosphomannomutase
VSIDTDLLDRARVWLDDDPDLRTREDLAGVISRADRGDERALADLADRFSGMLQFGTAGLRGALGAGPNRMNRAVVIRAAAGLATYLDGVVDGQPTVVIGFDARYGSSDFARDTAAVVTAAGGRALLLPKPLPTPVLAFAIRHLEADAGVMVTASHNPAQDNGYKVYLGDGSQIVPPADVDIAAHIAKVASVGSVPRTEQGWETLDESLVDAYVESVARVVSPDTPRAVSVVHTALHGVGDDTVRAAFRQAGFMSLRVVADQALPDPDFPTVSFPNPEEPGAMDHALVLARQTHPDIVIANDPDADRCAAAIPDGSTWRMLRGDEVGALLGWHLLQRGVAPGRGFANSIVSSRLLSAMAAAAGVPHEDTLTGFKWIARVPGLAYGYEEALGYCVAPDLVKDKDGISAALLLAELTAVLKESGRSVSDVLDDLALEHGVYATDSFAVRVTDVSLIGEVMARLREAPPERVAALPVSQIDDLAAGDGGLPPTEGIRFFLADRSRIIVRPSGTEPKVKIYMEVIEPVTDGDLAAARARATKRLARIRADFTALTAIG